MIATADALVDRMMLTRRSVSKRFQQQRMSTQHYNSSTVETNMPLTHNENESYLERPLGQSLKADRKSNASGQR